jgi:hypothetical protein
MNDDFVPVIDIGPFLAGDADAQARVKPAAA